MPVLLLHLDRRGGRRRRQTFSALPSALPGFGERRRTHLLSLIPQSGGIGGGGTILQIKIFSMHISNRDANTVSLLYSKANLSTETNSSVILRAMQKALKMTGEFVSLESLTLEFNNKSVPAAQLLAHELFLIIVWSKASPMQGFRSYLPTN